MNNKKIIFVDEFFFWIYYKFTMIIYANKIDFPYKEINTYESKSNLIRFRQISKANQ